MSRTKDHETVSIYQFTEDEVDLLLGNSNECVLMWATKDGWPVGVTHAFVWAKGKVWVTFTAQRHRASAIRRDNRVSVNISSAGYPAGSPEDLPSGAITFKGHGEFFEDDETKHWFFSALSKKVSPDSVEGEKAFYQLLDSPLRIVLAVTPVKRIMYNAGLAERHIAGTAEESELASPLESDTERLARERERRGIATDD